MYFFYIKVPIKSGHYCDVFTGDLYTAINLNNCCILAISFPKEAQTLKYEMVKMKIRVSAFSNKQWH